MAVELETVELYERFQMRKPHACGGEIWKVIRVGADIKLKCETCGRIILLERDQFKKRAKKRLGKTHEE